MFSYLELTTGRRGPQANERERLRMKRRASRTHATTCHQRRPALPVWLAGLAAGVGVLAVGAPAAAQEREYELVSPADASLYDVFSPPAASAGPAAHGAQLSTDDGRHTMFGLADGGLLPGMSPDGEVIDFAIASRGPAGWRVAVPLGSRNSGVGCSYYGAKSRAETLRDDGQRLAISFQCPADKRRFSGTEAGTGQPLDDPPGDLTATSTLYDVDVPTDQATFISGRLGAQGPMPRSDTLEDEYIGWSPDMSTAYFVSRAQLTAEPYPLAASTTRPYLYRRTNGVTTLVTRSHTGEPFPMFGVNPKAFDRPGASSRSGAAVNLTAPGSTGANPNLPNGPMVGDDTNAVQDVYQVRNGEVLWVSDPSAVPTGDRPSPQTPVNRVFEAASADGAKVFFSTTEQMTADDTDTARDLYVYDSEQPADARISRVSLADSSCLTCNDNASEAGGQGNSQAKLVTVSDDGSRVFFITGDVLSADDTDAQQSIYAHAVEDGATTFVAPAGAGVTSATTGTDAGTSASGSLAATQSTSMTSIGGSFSNRPLAISPDGRVAAFSLATDVTLPAGRGGPDLDSARDLFVWRDGDGLRRVRQGLAADANTATVPSLGCYDLVTTPLRAACRAVTDDGSALFFETTEALAPGDGDGAQLDVYAVDTADGAIELISPPGDGPTPSRYVDSSASGQDVFLLTAETLDPSRDGDLGRIDLYTARTGGVFPPLAPPPPGCARDACQPPGPAAPGAPPARSGEVVESDDVAPAQRVRRSLRVLQPTPRAVRRMARTGRLPLRVRLAGGGTIRLGARARVRVRVGGRVRVRSRRVATARRTIEAEQLREAQAVVRLSRKARQQLRRNGRLGVQIRVRVSGLGTRGLRVVPRRPKARNRSDARRSSARDDRQRR